MKQFTKAIDIFIKANINAFVFDNRWADLTGIYYQTLVVMAYTMNVSDFVVLASVLELDLPDVHGFFRRRAEAYC